MKKKSNLALVGLLVLCSPLAANVFVPTTITTTTWTKDGNNYFRVIEFP